MAAKKETAPKKKGSGALGGLSVAIIMAVCAVAMLPTTILVVVGMIPTAVAYFVDTSRELSLGPTVLCLNFAGVLPTLLKLWKEGHTVTNALDIITMPLMLMLILLPAACGWLLFNYVPYLVIGFIRRKAQNRLTDIDKYQKDMVEQWGSVVTGSVPRIEIPAAQQAAKADLDPSLSA